MKLAIVGRSKNKLKAHLNYIKPYLGYISPNPDVIIAIGGDGTFLAAENYFPGIPKLLVRHDSLCNKCETDNIGEAFKRLLTGRYQIEDFSKIKAKFSNILLEAANDIVIRNAEPIHAIRFDVYLNGKLIGENIIGDGIIVSTAFGSDGYFKSITKKHFDNGFAVAFNNITFPQEPIFLSDNFKLEVMITRGIAHLVADNNPDVVTLYDGDKIEINRSSNVARIVKLNTKV